MSAPKTQNILVIKLGALGDFIQSLGAMRGVRAHHQDAKITLLTTKPFVALAEKSKYFDEIIIDERPKFYQLQKWLVLRNKLNDGAFCRVYDLQNNDRTGIYFKLMSPRPEWVGTAKGASHRNISPARTQGLAFYGHQQTLALGGVSDISIDTLNWIEADISKFNLKNPYALLVAGSAPTRPEKRWPASYYAEIASQLVSHNIQPVLIGTDDEGALLNEIKARCPEAVNLGGQTSLYDIPALTRGAQFALGNDTGPMHLIAPSGTNTLVLFSRHSNPKRHAPLGDKVQTLQVDNLEDLTVQAVMDKLIADNYL